MVDSVHWLIIVFLTLITIILFMLLLYLIASNVCHDFIRIDGYEKVG